MRYFDILEAVNHKSSYVGEYGWNCYGNAVLFDLGEDDQSCVGSVVLANNPPAPGAWQQSATL